MSCGFSVRHQAEIADRADLSPIHSFHTLNNPSLALHQLTPCLPVKWLLLNVLITSETLFPKRSLEKRKCSFGGVDALAHFEVWIRNLFIWRHRRTCSFGGVDALVHWRRGGICSFALVHVEAWRHLFSWKRGGICSFRGVVAFFHLEAFVIWRRGGICSL